MNATMKEPEKKAATRRVLSALCVATCVAVIMHTVDSRFERQERRAERSEARALLARQDEVRRAPLENYFLYTGLAPVHEVNRPDEKLLMQSSAIVHHVGLMTHNDRLRCYPIDDIGRRGAAELLPPLRDEIRFGSPRVIGPAEKVEVPEGYVWVNGQWYFSGVTPDGDADCKMISTPCVEVLEVRRCQDVESEWIVFRSPWPDRGEG